MKLFIVLLLIASTDNLLHFRSSVFSTPLQKGSFFTHLTKPIFSILFQLFLSPFAYYVSCLVWMDYECMVCNILSIKSVVCGSIENTDVLLVLYYLSNWSLPQVYLNTLNFRRLATGALVTTPLTTRWPWTFCICCIYFFCCFGVFTLF